MLALLGELGGAEFLELDSDAVRKGGLSLDVQ